MSRVRRTVRCANCGLEPRLSDGQWVCSCNKTNWVPKKGCAGSEEDRTLLQAFGWKLVTDSSGFAYWLGPGGAGVVTLYDDGTWGGGSAEFTTLEEYLHWYQAHKVQPVTPARKEEKTA